MAFNSVDFLIFLPLVVLGYYIMPKKIKNLWLLIASYYFYMCWNAKYAVLILASTVITYLSGIIMEKIKLSDREADAKKKLMNLTVAGSFITNLGILGYFKYTNFFLGLLRTGFAVAHINLNVPTFDILLPVGISFYTFQALSYTMDVYRDEIYAEKNFIQYALFVSFFPQLVAGPIERSKNLLKQLSVEHKFDYEKAKEGFLLILWGLFLKIVIADRVAIVVDTIFNDADQYKGAYIVVGAIFFSVQLYCDFYGYSIIAKGAAALLGIDLMENFNYPYIRTSVADFWRGWHISLSTWFRDYLYIPLGGNRKGKLRKYLNLLIVFTASGLWHGAAIHYVIWGVLNGVYQVIGDMLMPIRKKVCEIFRLDRNSIGHKAASVIGTYILVTLAWVFFRAQSASLAISSIKSIFTTYNPWVLVDGSLYNLGIDQKNFNLLLVCIGVLLFADFCKLKQIVIHKIVLKQHLIFRSLFIAFVITFLLVFGIWGAAYDAAGFIYFQF